MNAAEPAPRPARDQVDDLEHEIREVADEEERPR